MAQSQPTVLTNDNAVAVRSGEVPAADFNTGMNQGASNACGVGIAMGQPNMKLGAEGFTLTDQHGAARTPQNSAVIGNTGLAEAAEGIPATPVTPVNNGDGDGAVSIDGTANLASEAAGWTNA